LIIDGKILIQRHCYKDYIYFGCASLKKCNGRVRVQNFVEKGIADIITDHIKECITENDNTARNNMGKQSPNTKNIN